MLLALLAADVTPTGKWNFEGEVGFGTCAAFADADATPSVADGSFFKTANTGATTITMFDGGFQGQRIVVLIQDANTTIDFTGTNLEGNVGVDWTPTTGDWMDCIFDGTNWYCSCHDTTA